MNNKLFGLLLAGLGLTLTLGVGAEMAQRPLITTGGSAPPNLVFTLDDSGSMNYECVPDALCAGTNEVGTVPVAATNKDGVAYYDRQVTVCTVSFFGTCYATETRIETPLIGRRLRSARINPLYYNPEIVYKPWLKSDGTRYPAYPATAAPDYPGPDKPTRNLVASQSIKTQWCTGLGRGACAEDTQNVVLAQYFLLSSGTGTDVGDFTKVVIESGSTYPKAASRTDCAGARCTFAEEAQNFSNWYTYSRSRILLAIGGTAEAFASVPAVYRVGYGRINDTTTSTVDSVDTKTLARGVRPFTGTDKDAFYTWLFARTQPSGGTPLRRAMDDVGQYFSRADNNGPWSATPGRSDSSAHVTCRRSFHVLMTDGIWTAGDENLPPTIGAAGNVDGTDGPSISGPNSQSYVYRASRPYSDSNAGTLADVAMYYWNRDLRPDLENGLKGNDNNPAFWQHMVNHTIGFGVNGNLRNPDDLVGLKSGAKTWGNPSSSDIARVDDLWHAAINSRGTYSSARNSVEYANALQSVFADIAAAVGKEAGVAVAGRLMSSSLRKYVPSYDPTRWSGDVQALVIEDGTQAWSAAASLPIADERNIFSYDREAPGNKGILFKWANLTDAMKIALFGANTGGENLTNYLRGNRAGEGSIYRTRATALGDIVNSTPVLVKDLSDLQYEFLPDSFPERLTYVNYIRSKGFRQAQLFVGANDGMLHAFNDTNGVESFAFVPSAVLRKMKRLSNLDYNHEYFVDGPLLEADVYDAAASRWRNLVIGGGGAGAKNLFAINVPVPAWPASGTPAALTAAQSAPGAGDILWEISSESAGYEEMGHLLQTPEAGVLRDGTWAVVVGNGYESASKKAQLLIINAKTGALIKKIDTGVGGVSSPNGLSGVRLVRDSQQRIVAAYAGDLLGNLWKFDLSSSTPSAWDVAFGGSPGTARNPLYKTPDAQPITSAPTFLLHPQGGVMILFGTGRFFDTADVNITAARALYGVWDKVAIGSASTSVQDRIADSNLLVSQEVSGTAIAGTVGGSYFSVTSNTVDYASKRGWMLPLTILSGLRSVYDPQISTGRVFFETIAPVASASQICSTSTVRTFGFVLDPFTGSPTTTRTTFDTNNDRYFSGADDATAGAVEFNGAGRHTVVGRSDSKFDLVGSDEKKPLTVQGTPNSMRRYWRQVITPPV